MRLMQSASRARAPRALKGEAAKIFTIALRAKRKDSYDYKQMEHGL
jgi:hypothetical protein